MLGRASAWSLSYLYPRHHWASRKLTGAPLSLSLTEDMLLGWSLYVCTCISAALTVPPLTNQAQVRILFSSCGPQGSASTGVPSPPPVDSTLDLESPPLFPWTAPWTRCLRSVRFCAAPHSRRGLAWHSCAVGTGCAGQEGKCSGTRLVVREGVCRHICLPGYDGMSPFCSYCPAAGWRAEAERKGLLCWRETIMTLAPRTGPDGWAHFVSTRAPSVSRGPMSLL